MIVTTGLEESEWMLSSPFGFSFQVTVGYLFLFCAHQFCIGISQWLNCGSLCGLEGGAPVIFFLSTQYKIEWTLVTTFSSRVSGGVSAVASFPEILSIKKLSLPS